jgi:RimJ/RimL family protein N-acetyltransferase
MEIVMETERFYFVRMDTKYVDFYLENVNNPEIYQYISTYPARIYTKEEEIEWVENNKHLYSFTIIDKETNELVGNAGYHEIKNEIGELGIWIAIKHQNKHYGREILNRLIEYGYQELNLKRIYLTVHENNERAMHLYEKLGFFKQGRPANIRDGIGNPTRKIHMTLKKERR